MLIVLADDFSGAAEIGGIGHRYGLKTEIQLTLDAGSAVDLLVLDTDTRAMSEASAMRKISELSAILRKIPGIRLFKKIDSVMRGHLIPELNSLQQQFSFNRILVLPANPLRGRKIMGGKYYVNDVPLNETVFAVDPDFPCTTADLALRLRFDPSILEHVHVDPSHMPSVGLVTGDVTSTADLKKYVAATNDFDLCVGGGELFECFLEHLAQRNSVSPDQHLNRAYVLIINGSTVKSKSEKELFDRMEIVQFSVPGTFSQDTFTLHNEDARNSFAKIVNTLQSRKVAIVSIAFPIHPGKAVSEIFLNYFVELMQYITTGMQMKDIHFCVTGGATASSMIRNLAVSKFQIIAEIASGVVSLQATDNNALFTVKPGSYPWPEMWLEKLLNTGK